MIEKELELGRGDKEMGFLGWLGWVIQIEADGISSVSLRPSQYSQVPDTACKDLVKVRLHLSWFNIRDEWESVGGHSHEGDWSSQRSSQGSSRQLSTDRDQFPHCLLFP
jgi:hypothetical protein